MQLSQIKEVKDNGLIISNLYEREDIQISK